MSDRQLVIPIAPGTKLLQYQIEMINYNPGPGILPLSLRIDNQETSLHYQTGSLLSVADFLRREDTGKIEIMPLLIKMVDIILESKKLFLNPAAFSLELNHVFIEPKRKEPGMVYLPVEPSSGLPEALGNFLMKILLMRSDIISDSAVCQQVLTYLKQDYVGLSQFRGFLLQSRQQRQVSLGNEKEKPFSINAAKVELSDDITNENVLTNNQEMNAFLQILAAKRKQIISFLIAQLLIAILLLIVSPFISKLGDSSAVYGGIVLIIGGVNILLLKKIFIGVVKEKES